jgi:ferritin-like metal-binding protein YciE
MAKELGERDAAQLLQENLDQEKAMAKRVEALSKELGKQAKSREAEREKKPELAGARSGRK